MSSFAKLVQGGVEPGCRARAALNRVIEHSAATAAVAVWVRHKNAPEDREPLAPAWTDGKAVYYAPEFGGWTDKEQMGVLVHEVMHVSLMHPYRARNLSKVVERFDNKLFNVAADAIINQSLKAVRWLSLPGKCIYLDELMQQYERWCREKNRPVPQLPQLSSWSVEDLYRFLAKWREEGADPLEKMMREAEASGWGEDLEKPQSSGDTEQDKQEQEAMARQWRRVLERAKAGDKPGGVFKELSGDIPRVETPWEHLLRTQVMKATMPCSEIHPLRPSRRWLVLTEGGTKPEAVGYDFGINHSKPSARIVVMIDTSGSIYGCHDLLERFTAEIDRIQRCTKAEIHLITCDAAVHQEEKIPAGGFRKAVERIKKMGGYKGGGGTDFRPAIEAAKKAKPDIAVYLTDMEGTFPDRPPGFKVVWAVPTNGREEPPQGPFGVTIALR